MAYSFARVPPSNRLNLLWKMNEMQTFPTDIGMFPGEVLALTITVEGSNAPSGPAQTLYKSRSSYATALSGSSTASGQVITTKTITAAAGDGGSDLSLITMATIASQTLAVQTIIHVLDEKDA